MSHITNSIPRDSRRLFERHSFDDFGISKNVNNLSTDQVVDLFKNFLHECAWGTLIPFALLPSFQEENVKMVQMQGYFKAEPPSESSGRLGPLVNSIPYGYGSWAAQSLRRYFSSNSREDLVKINLMIKRLLKVYKSEQQNDAIKNILVHVKEGFQKASETYRDDSSAIDNLTRAIKKINKALEPTKVNNKKSEESQSEVKDSKSEEEKIYCPIEEKNQICLEAMQRICEEVWPLEKLIEVSQNLTQMSQAITPGGKAECRVKIERIIEIHSPMYGLKSRQVFGNTN